MQGVSLRSSIRISGIMVLLILLSSAWFMWRSVQHMNQAMSVSSTAGEITADTTALLLLGVEVTMGSDQPHITSQWTTVVSSIMDHTAALKPVNHLDGPLPERIERALQSANSDMVTYLSEKDRLSAPEKIHLLTNITTQLHRVSALGKTLSTISQREIQGSTQQINLLISLAFVVVSLIVLMGIVSGRMLVTAPVEKISEALGRLQGGNLNERLPSVGAQEFQHIARTVNETMDRLNQLTVSRDKLEDEVEERRIAEQQAVEALQKLKEIQERMIHSEKLSALGTFVGGVAHEMNNPLMGISNYVSFVSERVEDPKLKDILGRANEEIERITRIVRNMLIYARSSPSATGSCELPPVIDRVSNILQARMRKEEVTLELALPDTLPTVQISADSLQQIMTNLMVNALDVLKDREQKQIRITVQQENDAVLMHFVDSGAGVSDEARRKIFEPFFTTKPPGKGTGLGLSISAQLAVDAGGELSLETKNEGEGAHFVLRLLIPKDTEEQGE